MDTNKNAKKLNTNLLLLIFGRMVSDIGSSIHMLIMPLYIIDSGASPGVVGLFSFLSLIPTLIIYPFGGAIGDRLDRKKLMVFADGISAIILLALFIVAKNNQMNILFLLFAQVGISLCYGFFDPATKGMVPQLVARDSLAKANSTIASTRILSGLVAPMVAVTLYTQFGVAVLFLLNGLSFLFSATTEFFIRYKHTKSTEKLSLSLVLKDLHQGCKFIYQHKSILSMSLYFLLIYAFIQPIFSVILPIFYRTQLLFSDGQYGLLQMILLIGALVGSIIAGKLGKGSKNKKVLYGGILTMNTALMTLSFIMFPFLLGVLGKGSMIYFILLTAVLFMLYVSIMLINIPVQTMIQSKTPTNYMSRIFSIVGLISKGGMPLGALVYGVLLNKLSIHIAVVSAVAIVVMISVVFIMMIKRETPHRKDDGDDLSI